MKALRAARLFDGVADRLMQWPVVLTEGGLIVDVIEHGRAPVGVPLTDLGNVTLLPGLVDAHVHLTFAGKRDPLSVATVHSDRLLENARSAAKTCLDVGITTARDLGDRDYVTLQVRDETARTLGQGPHLLVAGPPITVSGGHCWFLGGQADDARQLLDAVADRARRGTDLVKIMVSGGEITPGSRPWDIQYSLSDLRSVVESSHGLGLPVAAHAHAVGAIKMAINAGVDTIEHASFRCQDGVRPDGGLIAALARSGIPAVVTAGSFPGARQLDKDASKRMAKTLEVAVDMHDAGVRIVCASDAGISDQKPHGLLPWNIIRLVRAGLPALQALRAATSVAADSCRLPSKGRLVAGVDADLVAIYGDPSLNIDALLEVRSVYRAGLCVRSCLGTGPPNSLDTEVC